MSAIRIVLADDAVELRQLIRVALTRDGRFDVVGEASNGREAIALADAYRPDAVVLDLAMPVMDGLEALPEILRVSPLTKVVILSGFDREDFADQALALGAHAFVEKGVEIRALGDRIVAVLDGG